MRREAWFLRVDSCSSFIQAFWLPTIDDWPARCLAVFCTARVASRKNSEGTKIIVGLDHLTGLESILPHGLPKNVLYICSKEKSYFAELLQKDSWCGRLNWDSDLPAVTAPSSSRGVTRLVMRVWWGPQDAFSFECICCWGVGEVVHSAHPFSHPHKCMGSHSSDFEMLGQLSAPCPPPACLVTGSPCVIVAFSTTVALLRCQTFTEVSLHVF